jgi:peptidyl-prolyl cis-trans isomerase D
MLGFFRRILKSKFGGVIALVFLGLVAFAFAAGDIERRASSSHFFGTSDSEAAKVGSASVSSAELQDRVQRVFEANRRDNPGITIDQFLKADAVNEILRQLAGSLALDQFARDNGMRPAKKLVDAEIARVPAFQDASGKFNQAQYQQILQREKISEQAVRADFEGQILQRHLLGPASAGFKPPATMVQHYASMLLEERKGRVIAVPSEVFAPKTKPDDATLQKFYTQSGARFNVPEQRRIRYALIELSRFVDAAKPTEAEIQQYFREHASTYAASETRTVRQLVLLNESAARDAATKIGSSGSLDTAAKAAGLETTTVGPLNRAGFATATSEAAAQAVFGAARGATVGPIKTGLGWALFRVEAVNATPAKTLDAARGDIIAALTVQKSKQALSDFANKIDGSIGDGATFDDIAKANGLTVAETPAMTADGRVVSATPIEPNANFAPLAKAGFAMEQGDDPQLVQVVPDERVAIVTVGQVIPAGPPPLAQVRAAVEQAWAQSQGAIQANKIATQLQGKIDKGMPLEQAMAGAGVPLPAVAPVGARRADLGQGGKQVPPHLAALFAMKAGTSRVLKLEDNRGYLVVHLDGITPGNATGNAQVLAGTATGLSSVLSTELADQFQRAIEKQVGVTHNPAGIARVTADLRKANGVAQ